LATIEQQQLQQLPQHQQQQLQQLPSNCSARPSKLLRADSRTPMTVLALHGAPVTTQLWSIAANVTPGVAISGEMNGCRR
jgi:hypothetical protein